MFNQFRDSNILHYVLIGLLVVSLSFYSKLLGLLGVLLLLLLMFYAEMIQRAKAEKWKNFVQSLSTSIDSAAKHAVFNLPIPLCVLASDGNVTWYNSKFQELAEVEVGGMLSDMFSGIEVENLIAGMPQMACELGEKVFDIYPNIVSLDSNQNIVMLYFFDKTEHFKLLEKYNDEQYMFGVISVDNIEEINSELKEDRLISIGIEIEKIITKWAASMNGFIKKYAQDKYFIVFEHKYMEEVLLRKFSILDEVREIETGKSFPITLSIGIGYPGSSPKQQESDAFACLELALGRGGDQAVVKKNGSFEFYGGKTKAVEKRNKVKARVVAHGIRSLIDESSKVIVMGHRAPDMDSYGAAVGMMYAVQIREKPAYMVLRDVTDAITAVHETFEGENIEYISCEEAIELLDDDTLLVVVDTHKQSLTECPRIVELAQKVVLIDHHRRSTEYIDKAVIKYVEPYASSTAELVTEILQYIDSKVSISPKVADALLAGITVDTKNFTLKTGVRTFEAAGYLRKHGADSVRVRQLFQDDLETFKYKASIVAKAERLHGTIAVSATELKSNQIHLIVAQAADELLDIKGITASFVIAQKLDGEVFISGRSLGEVNVQVILEAIGGGGHLEVAGAQFRDMTVAQVKNILLESIDKYHERGDFE